MNLNSFIYAIEIERCGSINRAAQNLYLSQSNLSASIKALEDELGFKIFNRTSKGIVPTPEGYLFLQSAKAINSELDKVYNIACCINSVADISLSATWSSHFLRNFIDFKAKNQPNIQDSYKETGLIQNFQDIQEHRYRLAIFYCFHSRAAYHQEEAQKTNLSAELLASNIPAVALLSKNHPLAQKTGLSLDDIHAYPLALFDNFEDADWINILKVPPRQSILYLFDRGAITDTLLSDNYISVVKKGSIRRNEDEHIVELPITDLNDDLDIFLLKHKSYALNHREKAFVRYFRKHVAEVRS